MFTEGIFPIGDGLLDIEETRLKSLLVQDDINEIYDIEQNPFARGKFAAVRRAVHKNSGVHFAAKFLKRRRRAQSSDKEIKHEIAVLTLCDGAENIVKLNAVHESRSDTALLLELATGGELQTLLDNEECLSEAHARFCMREVLKALQFLHKRSIAHLDLKPQNILLIGEQIEDGLKLCDFGISRVVAEGTNVREILGTPDYVAPEVLQYEPLSLLTDIWSVGVLTYVLLSGFSPFGGDTKQETFLNISQCALTFPDKLFGGVSAAAIDFIRRALRIKPSDRMTAAGCLEHVWLKDECSIDRHMFENNKSALNTLTGNGHEHEHEDDEDIEDEEDDDDEEEEEEHDISIETDENGEIEDEEFEQSAINGVNNHNKMVAVENGVGSFKTKTTAVHTVPAARATTIPLCNAQLQQQPQQQQQQHQAARRHSTDSNKENTFLSSKKILPAAICKKTTTTVAINNKSTATIILATDQQLQQQQTKQEMEANNVIATIKLPNGNSNNISSSSSSSNSSNGIISAAPSLFPDAPTTPKVIRKAPNTDDDDDGDDDDDTSPTSVKALVKKFQLEGAAEKHLKETTLCNHQQQHVAHIAPRKSLPTTMNGKLAAAMAVSNNELNTTTTKKLNTKSTNGHYYHNNNSSKHISNMLTNGNRRLSEPLTAVHHHHQQQKKQMNFSTIIKTPPTTTSSSPPVSPLSAASDTAAMSYKTTCVYCLTCGSTATDCCTNGGETNGAAVVNGCRHPVAGPSSSSCSSSTNNSSNSTAAAILLSSHRHQQLHHHHHAPHSHHHHHHVVVAAKSAAANNLSLDQGIIC